ncbi:hypothetical protein [Cetobacterium sp.]|uniref:hypothetical protein n=1 Tax=Cetobacterium sp. TaxID=2071632 RepID=UPI003F3A1F69
MKKIRMLFNFKIIYTIFLTYFFLGYFYPNFLQINDVYLYLFQYLGIYEKMLWIFLIAYGFSMFMKNPEKKIVLKIRLFFLVILGVATGYLYLLQSLKELNESSLKAIQDFVIEVGLLNINLGYIELYTFLKIFPQIRTDIFLWVLIFIIFISLFMVCGKIITATILSIINFFKRKISKAKESKRLKRDKIRIQKQAKLEKEIYDEICNIQKIYKEKDEMKQIVEKKEKRLEENLSKAQQNFEIVKTEEKNNLEDKERKESKNDISIEISEKERDITATGISVEHKD